MVAEHRNPPCGAQCLEHARRGDGETVDRDAAVGERSPRPRRRSWRRGRYAALADALDAELVDAWTELHVDDVERGKSSARGSA
jgi:hypothetical protein